jgi:uncharacterized protein with GYD domain
MPKYLFSASYTAEGARGLKKDGGTARRDFVAKMAQEGGGKLDAFYFAFGKADVHGILDLPDTTTALATSMAINGSGVVRLSITPLITPEEMDQACKKPIGYRAPGS